MNKEWSEINKTMQLQLKKRESFEDGINTLFSLRKMLLEQISDLRRELSDEEYSEMPFINANGYHCKNVAYSLWHTFRIEDIVAHSMIAEDEQVLFSGDHLSMTHSPIITTGNELVKEQISDFTRMLSIDKLYEYIYAVDRSSSVIIRNLSFDDMKRKFTEEKKDFLRSLNVVSTDENACWLIDYWCGKDIRGLLQMPFSRHWIMHIEACIKIADKIISKRK